MQFSFRLPRLLVAATIIVAASAAFAQTAVEWQAVAKATSGSCGDGATAQIVERQGKLNIKVYIRGSLTSEPVVDLKPDGSGTAGFKGSLGRQSVEVVAGSGKREIKTAQLDGTCAWSWKPQ